MEQEAEREIEQRPDHDGDDVVAASADRDRRRTGIGAALERDAVVHRPGEERTEQDDRTEIAVGDEMRNGPGLYADQHRMLEHALDIAGNVGRGDKDLAGHIRIS